MLLVFWLAWLAVRWGLINATWSANSAAECAPGGACWAVLRARYGVILFGLFPAEERWRAGLAILVVMVAVLFLSWPRMWTLGRIGATASVALTVFLVLMYGGVAGLSYIPTDLWGGLALTLFLYLAGVVLGMPIGVALALARRSNRPWLSNGAAFVVDAVRTLPMIMVLFAVGVLAPMVLPGAFAGDKLWRVAVAFAFVNGCYQSEIVRAGLQAVARRKALMRIDYLEVAVFSTAPNGGNLAAVGEFEAWPSEQSLSEFAKATQAPVTSCLVYAPEEVQLRWLTRAGSYVRSMCGHGTLGAAFAVSLAHPDWRSFTFQTPGGRIPIERRAERFAVTLPNWPVRPIPIPSGLVTALRAQPTEVFDAGRDILAVFPSEDEVRSLSPNMGALRELGRRGIIATAPGKNFDCVSRFFCPTFGLGVDEDPVTGSAHCSIAPFWAERMGKDLIRAYQASPQGGELLCAVSQHGVQIEAAVTLKKRASTEL